MFLILRSILDITIYVTILDLSLVTILGMSNIAQSSNAIYIWFVYSVEFYIKYGDSTEIYTFAVLRFIFDITVVLRSIADCNTEILEMTAVVRSIVVMTVVVRSLVDLTVILRYIVHLKVVVRSMLIINKLILDMKYFNLTLNLWYTNY